MFLLSPTFSTPESMLPMIFRLFWKKVNCVILMWNSALATILAAPNASPRSWLHVSLPFYGPRNDAARYTMDTFSISWSQIHMNRVLLFFACALFCLTSYRVCAQPASELLKNGSFEGGSGSDGKGGGVPRWEAFGNGYDID